MATGDDALICTELNFLEKGDSPEVGVEPLVDPKPWSSVALVPQPCGVVAAGGTTDK